MSALNEKPLDIQSIRLNVEANILLENFTSMFFPEEDLLSIFSDPERCDVTRTSDGGLLINLTFNGKTRSCQIQSGDWEPIVESTHTILMASNLEYKTRFISHIIAVSNCMHKLAQYEYETFFGTVGPDYVGNPEDDARECMKLWAE